MSKDITREDIPTFIGRGRPNFLTVWPLLFAAKYERADLHVHFVLLGIKGFFSNVEAREVLEHRLLRPLSF